MSYLLRRAEEEELRAKESPDAVAAGIHRRMAALYTDRAAAMSEHPEFDPIIQARLTV